MFTRVTMDSIQEQVLRAFGVVCEMLGDRGVDVGPLQAIGRPELEQLCSSQSIFTFEVNPSLLLIFYLTKMKIVEFRSSMFGKAKEVDAASMEQYKDKKCIFVFKDDITTQNRKSLHEFWSPDDCQIFSLQELQYNPSRHGLVPKHELVRDADQLAALLKRYTLKSRAQMPAIHRDDPMARYLGLGIGDIVRITRPSQTAGFYSYYRVCVA